MTSKSVETLIGAFVIVVAVGFLYFAYTATSAGSLSGYQVQATFNSVDGLGVGTDVRMSGIKIGTVSALTLNPKNYLAVVHLTIDDKVKLPADSSVKITSSGILGSPYLSIAPGGSDKMIAPGGRIMNTQGSIDLMSLIGRLLTSGGK